MAVHTALTIATHALFLYKLNVCIQFLSSCAREALLTGQFCAEAASRYP